MKKINIKNFLFRLISRSSNLFDFVNLWCKHTKKFAKFEGFKYSGPVCVNFSNLFLYLDKTLLENYSVSKYVIPCRISLHTKILILLSLTPFHSDLFKHW